MSEGAPTRGHDRHDLELVARAAAGDLAAHEAVRARDLLAACGDCAAIVDELRAIAAATRAMPSSELRARSAAAPRDFRLTAADAARLRPGGLSGILRRLGRVSPSSPRLGGALATLGLVGVIVSAGLPLLGGSAGGAPNVLEPQASDMRLELESLAPGGSPAAVGDGLRTARPDTIGSQEGPTTPAVLTATPPPADAERDWAPEDGSAMTRVLLGASSVALVAGVLLALAGRARRGRIE